MKKSLVDRICKMMKFDDTLELAKKECNSVDVFNEMDTSTLTAFFGSLLQTVRGGKPVGSDNLKYDPRNMFVLMNGVSELPNLRSIIQQKSKIDPTQLKPNDLIIATNNQTNEQQVYKVLSNNSNQTLNVEPVDVSGKKSSRDKKQSDQTKSLKMGQIVTPKTGGKLGHKKYKVVGQPAGKIPSVTPLDKSGRPILDKNTNKPIVISISRKRDINESVHTFDGLVDYVLEQVTSNNNVIKYTDVMGYYNAGQQSFDENGNITNDNNLLVDVFNALDTAAQRDGTLPSFTLDELYSRKFYSSKSTRSFAASNLNVDKNILFNNFKQFLKRVSLDKKIIYMTPEQKTQAEKGGVMSQIGQHLNKNVMNVGKDLAKGVFNSTQDSVSL